MKHFFTFLTFTLILCSATVLQAQRALKGAITDAETGEGLIGASIAAIGGMGGAVSDINGNFTLTVSASTTGLRISYTGYGTQEVALSDANEIKVALRASAFMADEVVVIGSRNQTRTKISTPVPVDVIPISTIVNEVGQVDINQILTYVAPSFQSARQSIADGTDHVDPAQLRGLGPDQVLVLINGKRRHQSALVNVNGTVNRGTVGTDMAAIPASAVERIEILRDGASAQYGSDAIAGVINIVLKNRVGVLDGSISVGQFSTEYDRNAGLVKLGRSTQLTDKVNDGETVQAGLNYGWALGDRGRYSMTVEYISRGETNRTGTYTGQIYPSIGGVAKDDSILGARGLDREDFDMRIGQSRVKGGGATFNFDYDLCGSWEAYAFGGVYLKTGNAAGFYRYPAAVVTNAKIYAPQVLRIYPNGFLPEIQSTVQDLSAAVGVRGMWKNWNVDLSNTFGHNRFSFDVSNSVNYTQVSQGGEIQTEFDAGGLTFFQNTSNLDLNRHFGTQAAGLNVGVGAEFRVDEFGIEAGEEASWRNYNTASTASAAAQVFGGFLPSNEGENSRNCFGLYVDVEKDFSEAFLVTGAVRFENYSDFGSTTNGKLAARYKIGEKFSLRASASTGFRAPSMQQRFYAKTNTLFVSQGGTLVPVESGTFTNDSRPAEILGIPKLKQETSVNFAAGITARPFAGFEVTVDAYQISINDRIVLTNNFDSGGDAALKALLDAANASQANFFSNAVNTQAQGLEAVLSYSRKMGRNQELRFTAAGAFIHNTVEKKDGKAVVKASPILEQTGQIARYFNREDQSRIEVASPQSKISATLNYKIGRVGLMLRAVNFGKVTYLDPSINPDDPTKFPANAFNSGALETLDQEFSPKTVVDASLSLRVLKGVTVTVGANNLFDTYQDVHTHSGNMSLGRFVYSRRVQQMGFNGRYVFGRLKFDLGCKG